VRVNPTPSVPHPNLNLDLILNLFQKENKNKNKNKNKSSMIPIQPSPPTTEILPDPVKDVRIAHDLIQAVKELHENGFVHRSIGVKEVVEKNGSFTFAPSEDGGRSDEITETSGFFGYHVAPERLRKDFRRKSWVEDDIYALGCTLLELSGLTLPWAEEMVDYTRRSELDQLAEDSAHIVVYDPLLQNNVVLMVALGMVHSDPVKRLTSLDIVLNCLKRHLDWPLPELVSHSFDVVEAPQTDFYAKLVGSLQGATDKTTLIVAALLASENHVNGYVPRKIAGGKTKVVYLQENGEPLFLLLPKKEEELEGGFAKVGRAARLLRQQQGVWNIESCYVLTSFKDIEPTYYKVCYPKEMVLYKMVAGHGIFPTHIASVGFLKKPHKRLGIYELVPSSLSTLIETGQCTPHMLYSLSQKVSALHALGIAHRDIKPENVLVHEDGSARLCDLDFAVVDEVWQKVKNFAAGTKEYLRKERIDGCAGSYFVDDAIALVRTANLALPKNQQLWLSDEKIDFNAITAQLGALTLEPASQASQKCCVLL